MANPRSAASIAGHPIHRMLIPFPIAFFIGAFVCDLAYWQTSNASWATAAMWLIGAGLVMAALAAVVGFIELLGDAQIRGLNDAWWHAGGNVVVVDRALQLVRPLHARSGRGRAERPDPVSDRGLYPGIYRLEGLGNGLSRPGRHCRCARSLWSSGERIAAARGVSLTDGMRASASLADTRRQFDLIADGWDAEQGPVSARASEFAARIGYLRAICRHFHRPRVLDLGCGTGQILLHLADVIARGVGIDISPAMIARARRNAPGMRLPFREGDAADFCMHCLDRFELVLLIGVLEHLPDQAAGLAEASRVLTVDGRLVVIAPHPWNPFFRLKRLIDGGRDAPPADHPSPLSLRSLAARHGLKLLATQGLPYTAWIEFNAVHRGCQSTESRVRSNPFAGLRGAFAAEFRRDRRYNFVNENSRTAGAEFVRTRACGSG